jgi:hypothetical protein
MIHSTEPLPAGEPQPSQVYAHQQPNERPDPIGDPSPMPVGDPPLPISPDPVPQPDPSPEEIPPPPPMPG